ncbi:sensor histidine kinase [Virgibacillus proomii]|uniref:sensor histidine kinase n=1 Tax=Virgibacillus proomii TaxID=84407 RepID=UPI001C11C6E1|nr:HAMP domain-containing sensor histidine kinase [Virgibacillus proomii]MBU5266964.1 HAMP domain-containing histidine kinase [Virgibacillus proomii]
MNIVVVVMIVIIIVLVIYIGLIQLQLRNINLQLEKRLREHTRQPVSVELINKDINKLTSNINKYLKAEENIRLKSIREDKKFRELIVNISHDLRTPLTAIKGYQQLMKREELSQEQLKRLKIAEKHTEDLENLIQHFFEYSYLSNAEPKINLERTNLNSLVGECLVTFIPYLEENNLSIQLTETPSIFVLADKHFVKRIIKNLIQNCIQHSKGVIEVSLLMEENAIISLKNQVKDLTENEVERLFERFYTGDQARSKSGGLGLAIVKLLAEQIGGSTEAVIRNNTLEIRVSLPLYTNK